MEYISKSVKELIEKIRICGRILKDRSLLPEACFWNG